MWIDRAERSILLAAMIAIPLWISPSGQEAFRVPKEAVFLGSAVLLLAVHALRSVQGRTLPDLLHLRRSAIAIILAGVAWTALTALTSTNSKLSLTSLIWLIAAVIFFVSAVNVSRSSGLPISWAVLFPAALTGAISLLQAFSIWTPIQTDALDPRHQVIGLLGNPNDVGMYLALASPAAASSLIERRTIFRLVALLMILGGLAATQSLTSIAAVIMGAIVILWRARKGAALPRLLIAAVVLSGMFAVYPPVAARIGVVLDQILDHDVDRAFSHRITGFRAATAMWLDRPIVGIGPGTFGWNYYDYKLRLEKEDPTLLESETRWLNLTDAHNDHLQILAETGLPGFALWMCALILLSRARRGIGQPDGAVVAVVLATLAMMQFPLRLAAPTVVTLIIAAQAIGDAHG